MIYGKLVQCRPVEQFDQEFLHRLNSDPVVRANVVGWSAPSSLAAQQDWFKTSNQSNTLRFIVETRDCQPVGLTGLWDINWHDRNAISGIKLGGTNNARGVGYGRDAVMAMMAFAFYDVGLERLYCTILASNTGSLKVYLDKCGWTQEGIARAHVRRNGEAVDLVHVGILRSEFDALPEAASFVEQLGSDGLGLDGRQR